MIKPGQLLASVKAGKFKPAYYFFGSEDFRLSEAMKYVARSYLPESQASMNLRKFDGRETRCGDLITELSTLPLLGERQVFAISNFQSFKPKEREHILKLLGGPDIGRLVILSSPASKAPKRSSAFIKQVSSAAEVVEFGQLTPGESRGMLSSRLSKEGLQIENEALNDLTELVAGNRGAIEAELSKLTNSFESGSTITRDDVHRICVDYVLHDIFKVADSILQGNAAHTLKMVKFLVGNGNSAVAIVTLMLQHFICVYLAKNGKRPLGNRAWLTNKFRQQGAEFDNNRLEQMILAIAQCNSELRWSKIKSETLLEMLIINLTQSEKSS